MQEHIEMAMKVGQSAVRIMEVLDEAHTNLLGIPEPIRVTQNKIEGKCIVVTGHNLFALEQLLKQTEGKGINIYTHSEMLACTRISAIKEICPFKRKYRKSMV